MSTRSNIAIKLNKQDLNRPLKLRINNVETEHFVEATEDKPYLQIYCHHDGYVSYMGNLLANHTDYNDVLSAILHGDTSSLDEEGGRLTTDAYAPSEGCFEDGDQPEVLSYPKCHEEYLYVFEDGKWTVSGLLEHDDPVELTQEFLENYNG